MNIIKSEIAINADGKFFRRVVTEEEIEISESIRAELSQDIVVKSKHMFDSIGDLNYGHVSASFNDGDSAMYTVPVYSMSLRAPFECTGGVAWPRFATSNLQPLAMRWTPPDGMRVYLMVELEACNIKRTWLPALSDDSAIWRLPIANLHENCMLCNGDMETAYETQFECVKAAVKQFESSSWNADLYSSANTGLQGKTKELFSYEGSDGKLVQKPTALDWKPLCTLVSNILIAERIVV